MSLDKIKKFFTRKSMRKIDYKNNVITNPERDWKILLAVFATLICLVIIFSFYLFAQINKGELFTVKYGKSTTAETIDKSLLNEIISFFEERQQNFDKLKNNRPKIIDPSL